MTTLTPAPPQTDVLCGLTDDEVRRLYADSTPMERVALVKRLEACRQAAMGLGDLARDVVGRTYIERPHTDALMAALGRAVERADQGLDTNIIISMPPGSGKSQIASVIFPLWLTLNRPTWEIGLISAEASLAEKFSNDVKMQYDQRGSTKSIGGVKAWSVGGKGGVLARGLTGNVSGRRLRVAIIDDPIKHMSDAYSKTMRDKVWSMWQSAIKPRMRPGSIVLSIATRWHEDDLNGRLLSGRDEDEWRQIVFPAIAEPGDALGREVGEPLLSVQAHETAEEALARWAKTKRSVGTAVFNALYQQHPGDLDGTVFKLAWWVYYAPGTLPDADQIITSWDLTFGTGGEETGDWCVGTAWQRTGNRYFLLDMIRFRGPFTVQLERMTSFIGRFPNATAHLVEEAANGAAAISTLRRTLDGIVAVPVRAANGSKIVRAQSVAPLVEARQVELPEGRGFVDDFVTELSAFPTGEHDDIVDSTSQALTRMRESDVGPVDIWTDRPRLGGW
jgi:predicted phage terminase large subunit-like protein